MLERYVAHAGDHLEHRRGDSVICDDSCFFHTQQQQQQCNNEPRTIFTCRHTARRQLNSTVMRTPWNRVMSLKRHNAANPASCEICREREHANRDEAVNELKILTLTRHMICQTAHTNALRVQNQASNVSNKGDVTNSGHRECSVSPLVNCRCN